MIFAGVHSPAAPFRHFFRDFLLETAVRYHGPQRSAANDFDTFRSKDVRSGTDTGDGFCYPGVEKKITNFFLLSPLVNRPFLP